MKIKEKEFEDLLDELKAIALNMGVSIRYEKGDFKGGYCLLKDSKVIVINKITNTQKKVMVIASALKELGIDNIYIAPKIREIIEEFDIK